MMILLVAACAATFAVEAAYVNTPFGMDLAARRTQAQLDKRLEAIVQRQQVLEAWSAEVGAKVKATLKRHAEQPRQKKL